MIILTSFSIKVFPPDDSHQLTTLWELAHWQPRFALHPSPGLVLTWEHWTGAVTETGDQWRCWNVILLSFPPVNSRSWCWLGSEEAESVLECNHWVCLHHHQCRSENDKKVDSVGTLYLYLHLPIRNQECHYQQSCCTHVGCGRLCSVQDQMLRISKTFSWFDAKLFRISKYFLIKRKISFL